MPIDRPAGPPAGDPPPASSWGFSGHVVPLIRTRDQARATIRFFAFVRTTIVTSPVRQMTTASGLPRVTPEDSDRWALGAFSDDEQADVIMRALKVIALDPAGRADTLLALDSHIAYLRGRFRLPAPA